MRNKNCDQNWETLQLKTFFSRDRKCKTHKAHEISRSAAIGKVRSKNSDLARDPRGPTRSRKQQQAAAVSTEKREVQLYEEKGDQEVSEYGFVYGSKL